MRRRREVIASLGALVAGALAAPARAEPESRRVTVDDSSRDFDVLDLFAGQGRGRRLTLLSPKHAPKGTALPLVVALHGLGETHDEKLGAFAWLDLYGLRASYARLVHPPVARTGTRGDLTDARLEEINRALARSPFRGLVVACPFTPSPKAARDPGAALDVFAAWIALDLVPRARREAIVDVSRAKTTLVGCSMGGAVALEVVARRPDVFGGVALVQGAVSEASAARHADTLAKAARASGSFDVHLLTSERDPFVAGHRALAAELASRKVAHELRVLPGPHDQPWLREAGTIEMLLYQDRRNP